MTIRIAATLTFIACSGITAAAAPSPAGGVSVDLRRAVTSEASIGSDRGPKGDRIAVTFRPAEWPHVMVKASEPWDWGRFGRLLLDIENPGPRPVAFGIRVDDDPRADGTVHCRTA